MKWHSCIIYIGCILFINAPLFSQSSKLSVGKEPAWIVKNEIDYSKTSLDKEATEGSVNMYFEAQISLAERWKYYRQCEKLISQAGVQNGSTISVSFDPTYQQLIFHTIKIIRKGETLNKLQLAKIKTIQQEEDLGSFIYNGTLDAVLILEDVRPGDIIEYSYSIKGFNPVFNNKYSSTFNTGFSVPVYDQFYRIIVPKGRTIFIKNANETIQPLITALNGQQVYEWRKSNTAPLVMQDNTPSWYNPFPRISVSEFASWKEVNDWAMDLFPAKKILSAPAMKMIEEIKKTHPDDAGRTMASLRFVQDDIRYMGIEMGRYSHKPADPSKIFSQRFGDCKEKSYLLCCMLNAMNISAEPVLISTDDKKELNNTLPSPYAFNHCTVRVKLDSVYYYFDPTIAYQRGNIKDLFYPDYQTGLVIGENTEALTPIAFRSNSYQHVNDYFKIDNMRGSGTLVVTTTYKGDEADGIRSAFNNQSIAEILASNKKFYARYYEDIKGDSLNYTDNDTTGIFTSTEYYTIPNFWTIGKDKVKKFSFEAFTINSIIRRAKERDRKMPIGLMYPASYQEEITVVLPGEWPVTESERHLNNKGFIFNSKFYNVYNQVHLTANYTNQKDFVNADESVEYFSNVKEYEEGQSFELSSSGDDDTFNPGASSTKTNNPKSNSSTITAVIIVVLVFGGWFYLMNRRR